MSDEVEIDVIELSSDTKIEINSYTKANNKLSKIGPNVKIQDFLKNVTVTDNLKVTVTPQFTNQEFIGTNTKIIISEKTYNLELEEYECLIYGDVNGNGEIDAVDYTLIKNDIMEVKKIIDVNMKLAADVNGDGEIDAVDYTLIKNDIMDVKKLTLK